MIIETKIKLKELISSIEASKSYGDITSQELFTLTKFLITTLELNNTKSLNLIQGILGCQLEEDAYEFELLLNKIPKLITKEREKFDSFVTIDK